MAEERHHIGELGRLALAALLVLLAGVAFDKGWMAARQALQPTGDAEWVWLRNASRWAGPQAFYVVHDFELEELPAAARLAALGDEEYVLFLNGTRVGGNRYVAGSPLDAYDVSPLLVEGTNRLAAHLRSSKGPGAFLLALFLDGSTRPTVTTSEDWRVLRRRSPKLYRPWLPIGRRERVSVVARPPEGRWGSTRRREERPLHDEIRLRPRGVEPRRALLRGVGWRSFGELSPRPVRPLGEVTIFDWGALVSGLVTLRFTGPETPRGLAYFGERPPDPVRQAPDVYVIGTPGQSYWEDVVPRRFRYLLLVGLDSVSGGRLVPTDPALLAPLEGGEAPPGVLSRPAPRLGSPTEDKVWSELERLASQAEGQLP